MSTRAFLTIIDEQKHIQMAAFCPSSAYPSYLGVEVLNAIEKCDFPHFIDEMKKSYPEEIDTVDGIRRDWYIKTAKNKDDYFHSYAYELNGAKQELTLYHYGDKALTIPSDQIPLYRFIFEHEEQLYKPLALDERSMTLKKDFYKEVRGMIKNGADQQAFQAVMDNNPSVLYVDQGRLKDATNLHNNGFNKYIRDSKDNSRLMLCVSEHSYDSKFSVYVQTPFVRCPLAHNGISSPAAAEKYIAELARSKPEDIRATIKIFSELEAYSKKVREVFHQDDLPLEERADAARDMRLDMMARLKEAKAEHQILGDHDGFLSRMVQEAVYDNYRWAKERMEKAMETKLSFHDALQDAAARAEVGKLQNNQQQIAVPER